MKTTYSLSNPARGTEITLLLAIAISLAPAPPAWAASPSELLEQGIYAEETKGDLDAATNAYRQAIAEARPGWAAAAQAQFRLGVCCYKKKDFASGAAAFDQVIKSYPEQKELVAQANDYLYRALPLLPAPWVDGEELRFVIKGPDAARTAYFTFGVNAGETNGQKFWRIETLGASFFQSMMCAVAEVDAATFRPLRSRIKSENQSWGADYQPGNVELWAKGVEGVKKLDLTGAVHDDYAITHLLRRLPLGTNYNASVTVMDPDLGHRDLGTRELAPYLQAFRVTGVESVTVPAGTYECYKVDSSIKGWRDKRTYWYSTDSHRYLVRLSLITPQRPFTNDLGNIHVIGGEVRAELSAVTRRRAGEPALYRDAVLGFSLTAPAGWRIVRYSGEEIAAAVSSWTMGGAAHPHPDPLLSSFWDNPKAKTALCLLDPDAACLCVADVGPLASLDESERQSLHTWAEEDIARSTKGSHYFDGQTNEWQELTIAGQPAVSVAVRGLPVGSSDTSSTLYGVWTFDNTNAVKFYSMMPTKDFGNLRPTLEAIVRSYTPAR